MLRRFALFTSLLLGLGGCAGAPAAGPGASLAGTDWVLTRLDGDPVPTDIGITLSFAADGRVSGYGGCNRYFGGYEQSGGERLRIGPLASTKMLCPGPGSKLEDRYLGALDAVDRFAAEDGRLQLLHGAGVLVFTRAP